MSGRRGITNRPCWFRGTRVAMLAAGVALSLAAPAHALRAQASPPELVYLEQVRTDFLGHIKDVQTIFTINQRISARIDSLLDHQAADTTDAELLKGLMNTRTYDLTILAYRDILNGTYISDPQVKLRVARHVAMFDGIARERVRGAEQWDQTARPYIYDRGLLSPNPGSHAIADPVFRSVLVDRRGFVRDVLAVTPRLLASADSVVAAIDAAIRRDSTSR